MKNAEAVLLVKFISKLSAADLMEVCQDDLDVFRNVPGLIQKYYITERSTGAISWFYIFEDRAARAHFWTSELAKSIPFRYGVISDTLRVEQYDMAIVLNDMVIA